MGVSENPWVVQDPSGVYRMYYSGWDTQSDSQIGAATSQDLVNWTRYSGNPVLSWGPAGTWDSAHVATHSVVLTGSRWVMYYAASANGSTQKIGNATSTNGFDWTKDAANPVIRVEPSPFWDDSSVWAPDLVTDPSGPRLYYAGEPAPYESRIGEYSFAPPPEVSYSGAYFSPVFDSGAAGTTWLSLASNASVPTGTSLSLRLRAGNDSTPDATWTAWVGSGSTGSLPRDRYLQVGTDFGSTNWSLTPTVASITVVYIPNGAPETVPAAPGGGEWTNVARPVLRWNATDPESDAIVAEHAQLSQTPDFGVIAVDSGNLTLGATSWHVPYDLSDGTWYWRVQAEDGYGAWGVWQSSLFRLDTAPPTLSISNPAPGALLHSGTLNIDWSAADAGSGLDRIAVSVDGGTSIVAAGSNSSVILNGISDGTHTVRVTAYDRAGNAASIALSIVIDTNVLSLNGPYGAWPLAVVNVVIIAVACLVAMLWIRRRRMRQGPKGPNVETKT